MQLCFCAGSFCKAAVKILLNTIWTSHDEHFSHLALLSDELTDWGLLLYRQSSQPGHLTCYLRVRSQMKACFALRNKSLSLFFIFKSYWAHSITTALINTTFCQNRTPKSTKHIKKQVFSMQHRNVILVLQFRHDLLLFNVNINNVFPS